MLRHPERWRPHLVQILDPALEKLRIEKLYALCKKVNWQFKYDNSTIASITYALINGPLDYLDDLAKFIKWS